jgi:UTP:GlnB (protein PII) uridylyltransferase
MAAEFLQAYRGRVAGSSPGSLVARLIDEQQKRHSRFGDTIFLLEPDLKSGPGGVRDLCAGRWAAFARFGPAILTPCGIWARCRRARRRRSRPPATGC